MNISNFKQTLPPVVVKEDVLTDLDAVAKSLQLTIKMVDAWKVVDADARSARTMAYVQLVKITKEIPTKGQTAAKVLLATLQTGLVNLETITEAIGKEIPTELLVESATANQLNLLSYINVYRNMISYTQDIIYEVTKGIGYALNKNPIMEPDTKITKRLLREEFIYTKTLTHIGVDTETFTKTLRRVPTLIVTDDNTDVTSSIINTQSEWGLSLARSGFIYNPIYFVRKMFADLSVRRYKLLKEKKTRLELMVLAVEAEKRQSPSPSIEKELKRLEERIEAAEYQIKKAREG